MTERGDVRAGSREAVKRRFAIDGRDFDEARFANPRGRLLSECDAQIFRAMLPSPERVSEVLEIGAGTGRFTTRLLEWGAQVIATDVNPILLDTLRAKVAAMGAADRCRIRVEDLFDLSFADESFDFACSFHLIPRLLNLEDQRAGLLEIARILKPGGMLFFNYRNSRSLYRFFFNGHMTAPEEIDGILGEAGLQIVEEQGKLLSSMLLFRRLPMIVNRGVVMLDVQLRRLAPRHAWDVFVLAKKRRP